jgi:demethylmenaquinone methyltransferase/2-methoxy-6-polyprenyl-1,4-benzoquinol methylase
MLNEANLTNYYRQRAQEYDAIYAKPEQQKDFHHLRQWLEREVSGKRVLEVACGTSYWTAVAARAAEMIVATDINESVLDIARGKSIPGIVQFIRADGYALPSFQQQFSCGMAHFWLSHVPKAQLIPFLEQFIFHLNPESTLLFIDSKYVAGYRKPASRIDDAGNAYQLRKLKDGSTFEIVKNFLSKQELFDLFNSIGGNVEYVELDYLWAIKVQL